MSENPFKGFEDFINYCNKIYNDNTNTNESEDSPNFQDGRYYCGDVPGGFQTIDPQFFLIIGELLGNVVAGKMPFNIQNVIGNWLQLVGQAIETYNAQQQYMQSGPGRYYDIRNLNVNNPFCPWNQTSSGQSTYEESSQYINRGSASERRSTTGEGSEDKEIRKMKENIIVLENEIEKLKKELEEIRNDKK